LPLRLHYVLDGEAFVGSLVNRSNLKLGFHDREDLCEYLLATLWELSLRFDGRQGSRFSAWARAILSKRVYDWQRQRYGRTRWVFASHVYEREHPVVVSLDTGLVDALGAGAGDPADSGDLGLSGVLGDGDRQRARDLETLGL
jgi:DNA-directed RNA polymerase specialized sigma24 family protein